MNGFGKVCVCLASQSANQNTMHTIIINDSDDDYDDDMNIGLAA